VRVLLAQGQTDLARQWIAEQRRLAKPLGHIQTLIELHLLEAVALAAAGQRGPARAELEAALVLAEPIGFIRPFLDAGEVIGTLLAERAGQPTPNGRLARYLNDLLASFRLEEVLVRLAQPASAPRQPLTEPLSERELEVLRLMAAGLSNQAIADQLVISVPTVKKHGSNILGKLYAANRTEAVKRARELGLLV
jgi:LuxR family maltose regulon positive regulatory protein